MCTSDGQVVWCEDGALQALDCPSQGMTCFTVPGINYSDCF
jgi:hypothetical protein